jgi:signal transduction histidine kinase
VITIRRMEMRPFTDQQITLLQTFADQAVIAIENVRLFTELQASNRELTTALDTQTATSDILRVISRSQTDVQPVFDAILASAVRLLRAYSGGLTRVMADQIKLVALTSLDDAGDAAQRARYPLPLQSDDPHAQAIRDRAPLNIADTQTDPRLPETAHAAARARGFRGLVAVPMLRHDEAIGAITVSRHEPGGFTDDEIALLQTFADQAVIAIENARLLTELHARTAELTQSVGELRALGEVGQAISSTLDLQTVLSTIVARATQLAGADAGIIYEYDAAREVFEPRATEHLEPEIVEVLVTAPVRKGEGATGQLAISPVAVQLPDIHIEPLPSVHHARDAFVRAGYRALLAVPLLREDHLIGGLTVVRKMPGEFPRATIELLQTFATQSALAIQNARLFRETEDKSRQLEAASQHKSEFLANMSHELRTPLNAIIGFSEVLSEKMFGDINEKQTEYLQDILESGRHLLSLINDILDLSKVEAGRMELELSEFDLPNAIDNALILVRERASRRGIRLGSTIDERLGMIGGDERKVKQVLLNLLSNALKFTPEGGRIDVSARAHDEVAEVSLTDTGVGIAPEDQEAVFEEFRQVGTADKKVEGTGLGLALSRKFIELHGGRIWVQSQVGHGSTFTFTLPVRREE